MGLEEERQKRRGTHHHQQQEDFQWSSFMADHHHQNPTTLLPSFSQYHRRNLNPTSNPAAMSQRQDQYRRLYQYPPPAVPSRTLQQQNPSSNTPQNLLYHQNPSRSENHILNLLSSHQEPNNHNTNNALGSNPHTNTHTNTNNLAYVESAGGFLLNPNFSKPFQEQSLESAFGRMSLSAPQNYLQLTAAEDDYDPLVSITNKGFSYAQANYGQQRRPPLSLMRSVSASAGLGGLARYNGNIMVDGLNIQHAVQSNRYFSDGFNLRSFREEDFDYGYPVNGMVFDSGSRIGRQRGSVSRNSSSSISPLHNHQLVQSRTRSSFSSLEQLRGKMAWAARDQESCRFLQNKLDEQIPEQTQMIFLEVKDHLQELVVDYCGNHLIQKLFEVCNEEQMNELVLSLVHNKKRLLEICIHPHGTRPLQKMIEHITVPEQRSLLISVLKPVTIALSKNQNGHHVIHQCFVSFPNDDTKCLIEEIDKECIEIGMDKSGCCILQQAVTSADGELKERLLSKIAANALMLSEDPYGNYVVQHVLGMDVPDTIAKIAERLVGNYINLSMNKYSSNVVEKCMKECDEEMARRIITELMYSPNFLNVLQDPYGNYVAQTALSVSKGELHHTLVTIIQHNYPFLHSHLHGKKVLGATRVNHHKHYHRV